MKATVTVHEAGDHKLVRYTRGGNQLHTVVPGKTYNPKVGLTIELPEYESVNLDCSAMEVDEDGISRGPDLEFGLTLTQVRVLHDLMGEFLEAEPWKQT